jgi:rare lipoprotein A
VIRHAKIPFSAAICVGTIAILVPAVGEASSGGGTVAPSGGASPNPTSPQSGGSVSTQPGDVVVSASGAGITIAARASALLRNGMRFSGTAPERDAGDVVEIERSGPRTGWAWEPTVQATVAPDGSFDAVWQTNHIGRFSIRAVVVPAAGAAVSSSAGWPTMTVTVYRPSIATLYGPGFWGRRTACGVRLRRSTIGLANRTLPCGTPVAVYYQGRTMVVPVIDRGPYAYGADWDLTMATARALGLSTTATIGAVSLPRAS